MTLEEICNNINLMDYNVPSVPVDLSIKTYPSQFYDPEVHGVLHRCDIMILHPLGRQFKETYIHKDASIAEQICRDKMICNLVAWALKSKP